MSESDTFTATMPPWNDRLSNFMTMTVDHSRLKTTDAASIRYFLRAYDNYAKEVQERARQLVARNVVTNEVVTPVNLKFCVDSKWLESLIALNFIDKVSTYYDLSDSQLRSFLEKKAKESKEVVTLNMLDNIVKRELHTNMQDPNAKSRTENLFISYYSMLLQHGLSWLVKENQKVAVYHVLLAIPPVSLKSRLESDLDFAQQQLGKDFKASMKHSTKLSEAFQLVDLGKPTADSSSSR